jgi:hypothetical protein
MTTVVEEQGKKKAYHTARYFFLIGLFFEHLRELVKSVNNAFSFANISENPPFNSNPK